jgi:hypothetical protein
MPGQRDPRYRLAIKPIGKPTRTMCVKSVPTSNHPVGSGRHPTAESGTTTKFMTKNINKP